MTPGANLHKFSQFVFCLATTIRISAVRDRGKILFETPLNCFLVFLQLSSTVVSAFSDLIQLGPLS